ncbi:tRNA (N(6)-L-threonylcarbamoyladenosine(37)-C(2))-methylthiotransferase [archaeon]|nr:tRNA (N(6)-L-threonylcarbamoyladenosine(37)-C(2))-methylthiotransferase [archaeon]
MKEVYIETYGCAANQNNSEIIGGLLRGAGYGLVGNSDIADIIVLNSCVVKGKTENKIKRRVQDLSKKYPKKILVIAGCMPETDAKELKKLAVDCLLLGTHNFKNIVNLLKNYENYLDKRNEVKVGLPKISSNKLIGITQISEGCLGNCSYCKTKLAKGDLFSFDIDDVVKSVESDLRNGAKEIWLTSQDCAVYGVDKYGESRLVELLRRVLLLKGRFKVRLGMMNPAGLFLILDEMISVFKDKKMYKFLHVPIQSGSDDVLKSMRRGYEIELVEKIVERFRKEFPDGVFATDVIVGYPSESVGDFRGSLGFVSEFKPDVFNLSKFSRHKGTEAWKLKELSGEVVSKRASELMECHRAGALDNKKKFVGKKVKVFVNKSLSGGLFEGRDENYNIVLVKGSGGEFGWKELLGKNLEVVIKSVGVHHMVGEVG